MAYGLRQILLAIDADAREILRLKKATELLENILFILDHTLWEPKYMVMNCAPGSWIPCQNDPMMLGSRLQDVRQKPFQRCANAEGLRPPLFFRGGHY